MKMKRLLTPLLLFTTVLFSACTFEFATVINEDGSGEVTIEGSGTEDELRSITDEYDEIFEDSIAEIEAECESSAEFSDFPNGATADFTQRGSTYSCTLTMPFDNIDELLQIYEEMDFGDVAAVELNSDEELTYQLELDMTDADVAENLGVDEVNYLWSVTVPGSPTDHNADRVRGSTLTWVLEPGEFIDIEVKSTLGSGNWLLMAGTALVCLLGSIGVGVVVGTLLRQNRQDSM